MLSVYISEERCEEMKKVPRIINEIEGGPSHIYLGKHPRFMGTKQILNDLKLTLTKSALVWEKMPLYEICEECEDCNFETCPKTTEKVIEKGSGAKLTEVLEGWFIDLSKCEPWKICECCHGKGYIA